MLYEYANIVLGTLPQHGLQVRQASRLFEESAGKYCIKFSVLLYSGCTGTNEKG